MAHLEHLSANLQRKIKDSLLTGDEAVALISLMDSHCSTVLLHSLECQNVSLANIVQKLIAQSNITLQLEILRNDATTGFNRQVTP